MSGVFCFLPFFDAIRKDGESDCIRFDTPSAPMPALRGRPFATGEMHEEAHRWNVRDA